MQRPNNFAIGGKRPAAAGVGNSHVPATTGRMGVLLAGLGAISTTLIAGVEAIKKGLAQPIGSLSQLGRIRIKTERGCHPVKIKDYVSLPELEALVFSGWDIVDTDCYEAACRAAVLDRSLLEALKPELSAIRSWPGLFNANFLRRVKSSFHKKGAHLLDLAEEVKQDILTFQRAHQLDRMVFIWCGSTEAYLKPKAVHKTLASFEAGLRANDSALPPSMVYAYAVLSLGIPVINATPTLTIDVPALLELAFERKSPVCGKDLKTGQTLLKTILAPGLRHRMLGVRGWYSTNILGNQDGKILQDPAAFKTKEESKLAVLPPILRRDLYPELYDRLHHQVDIHYYPPRGDNKESWDSIDIFGWLGYPMSIKINFNCRDSILAAPLLLDLALFMDLAKRVGLSGPQEWLSFYFKNPMCQEERMPEHDLSVQLVSLEDQLRRIAGSLISDEDKQVPIYD